ncbi:uncharacterized protein palmdb [Archocentrus centrarchus]|uniref:uncharacterized protein palmdb n=1 Tax=Archocentrus centrarchus TaxID=63155 RepID=UPI0011EA15F8|nr:uncharacterized protein LOC115799575 [Archocentrus centrarchus]
MEEADLLKERLQAITDKRRIQEEISKKRRQIEEEKLKLQYIKKKALREQWLMDGLSQQSKDEQEAMRLQAHDEQQQSDQLQSNITRIEKEIEALEAQELSISANEEVVLKRLKEVEKTAEDIIRKATSVDRETDGKELRKGCSTTENHNSITMETTEQSKLEMHCEVVVAVADSPKQDFTADDKQVYSETDPSVPEFQGEKVKLDILLTDIPTNTIETDKLDCSETNVCNENPCQDQKEALILELGHEELNRNESVTSSVSDTHSSIDSVCENETHYKRHDTPEQDAQQEQITEPGQYPDQEQYPKLKQYPEPEQDRELEQYPEPAQDPVLEQYPEPAQDLELEQYPEPTLDPELEQYPEPALDPELEQYPEPAQDPELEQYPEPAQDPELEQYPEPTLDLELEQLPEPEPEPGDSDNLNSEEDGYLNLTIYTDEDSEAHEILFEPPITEESISAQCIKEEAMSDVFTESCHEPGPEEMDECLRVEIAAASSDSETDEKWRTIFSSSINKEDDDSYLDSLQLSAQELFVQKVEVTDFEDQDNNSFDEVCFEVPQVEEILEQPEYNISFPTAPEEVKYSPLCLQGLSKISEYDSENGRNASHNHTSHQPHINADTVKKLPKDFCVIQETKSENVSTEHVDFQLARKQWREMEEQTKNKVVLPTTKQLSFHGSHSFMYTPVRNIDRTHKKVHGLENLNLVGDYPHTQFSPCSEDSGLDDFSYRSPYDDPETPVEREIRISLEREENFKRERGLSRMGKSTDCAPSRTIPRSISTPLTPSFIITSSPTKEPLKHELSANNVIILDPSNDFTSGSRHVEDNMNVQSGEWHTEDSSSNLIILETSNLIIRSASEFSLSKACDQPQEKMFLNNPFFKLRSRSTISLVDEEIKMVKQREDELKKERANLYAKGRFNTERVMSSHMENLAFNNSVDVPVKCKSSPSSPMKNAHRMDRSALSCDHRFPDVHTGGRRKSAMALRWEAGEFTKND